MQDRAVIHEYLKSLSTYLSRLENDDAKEVIKEIESHVYDVIESQEQVGESVDIKRILAGFGSPRELAAQYVDHVLTGTPPPKGFKVIQQLKRGVTKGVWFSMALFGFGVASLLGLMGILKIIFPEKLGVWVVAEGNSIVISFSDSTFPGNDELLGWWLVPISIIMSLLIFQLTKRVLSALKLNLH